VGIGNRGNLRRVCHANDLRTFLRDLVQFHADFM
jgi:hypothetical protein